ncbi:MAG: threonine--tRNA ligase [Patescibacteria group bacterium]
MNKKSNSENSEAKRHTLAHVLAMAVLSKYPDARLGIGPVIDNGFYYDFDIGKNFKENELAEFESAMRDILAHKLDITGKKITHAEAKKIFADQPFKLELADEYTKEDKELTAYTTGDFTDLCRGGHIENTREIDSRAFKLTRIAGAYWRGDEKNAQLQRIYGVAFDTKKELDEYFTILAEAGRRDHKKLGPELDLFTFSELVGPGLPLWTPKGTLLRDLLDNEVWKLRKHFGYERVDIPHITKKDLYERSGHWDKFKDELFRVTTREGHEFAMKPMNCPHHTQLYARRQWSYKELPQRYSNTTKVYRDEQSGELAGLSRVRAITQDDAHVFCRKSQVKEEMNNVWTIINSFYKKFGFELRMRLSLSDPEQPSKYLGSQTLWKEAEAGLRDLVRERGAKATEALGEAAFYGPKIDFLANDSLGREWQVATIQLDMNQPERFDLYCINEEGEHERIVMIHAAIMGSLERFLSVIIEHYAGAFPFWLAPVQVKILTINDKVTDYAEKVITTLEQKDIRYERDFRNESIGKKIREAEMQKVPYIFVIGDKEAAAYTINVRTRSKKETATITLDEFFELITPELN